MCKTKISAKAFFPKGWFVALGTLLAMGLPLQRIEAQPCNGGGLASTISVSPLVAHVGDVITITQLGVSLGAGVCTVSNGQSFLMYPNGNTALVAGPPTGNGLNGVQQYETNFNILVAPGAVQCLPTADAAAGCSPITTTYTVLLADVGIQLGPWTTPRGFATIFQPPKPKTIHFMAASDAFKTSDGLGEGGTAPAEVTIITPCIAVTKNCLFPQGQACFAFGQPIAFSGVVTNCGDTTLFGITVTDNPDSTNITFAATTSSGRTYDGSLTNGESIAYSGSYAPQGIGCGPQNDTIQAVGFDSTGFGVTNTASASCPVCDTPCIGVTKNCDTVVIGSLNTVSGIVTNCGIITLTNISVVDNIYGPLATIASLAPGASQAYSLQVSNACGSFPNFVTATGTSLCGTPASATATNTCVVTEAPCIGVTKICDTVAIGAANLVTAVVTNCGNVPLHGITVRDNLYGTVGTVATLAPGGTATLTMLVTNATCGNFTNVVTATGLSPCNTSVTNTSTAVCVVTDNPCIQVTKNCDTVVFGSLNTVSGVVTNCGNVILTNITVVDNVYGSLTTIASLAPGASQAYSQQVSNAACGSFPNTVTATGTSICGTPASATATNTCVVTCPPDICVTKGVVCAPSDGSDCGPGLAYAPSATGAAGPTNQASFCYEIVVWNCGSDVLTNVTVVDNKITIVAGSFPTTLAVNERATNYFQASYGPNTSTTNVVTATGTGQSSGIVTNAVAQAIANVLPVGVVCDVTLSSAGAVEGGQCEVTLDANNGSNQPVTFTLVITNTGLVDLNVALSGVPALVDCGDPTNAVTVPLSVLIPAGGVYTLTGCVLVSCPGAQFDVRVQGSAEAGTNLVCVVDADGNVVTTGEPSQCTAQVCCVTPVTCRTTGGGQLIPGFSNPNCIEVPTTIFPATAGGSNVVFKITHGGQLGAPYAHQDCGEILGNPCIRGQWEHNRHYEGKGNPKDTITAFHTVTPKGQFDSLSCACLPCCPSEGVTNAATTLPGKKFVLCNPDDHKICGPMPRPAPANALIWSGIGVLKHVDDNGSKGGEWVVLRVYIEDRSEPGGAHPGGSVDPADVYSFQAWKTGVLVTKKPDFTKIAPEFRFALAQDSCRFLEALQTGALPQGSLPTDSVNGLSADVIDKGPLYDGNRQIHPSTSATCTP